MKEKNMFSGILLSIFSIAALVISILWIRNSFLIYISYFYILWLAFIILGLYCYRRIKVKNNKVFASVFFGLTTYLIILLVLTIVIISITNSML